MAVKGLSQFRKQQENATGQRLYKIKPDTKVKVRFLNELDVDSKNFIKEVGTANFVTEFQHPDNYRLSFEDTRPTEGHCLGYELANHYGWKKPEDPEEAAEWKDWRPKDRMYINALVQEPGEAEKVVVMQLSLGPKAVQSNVLLECNDNHDTITDRWFAYSRKGSGQYDTTYSLTPLDRDDSLPSPSDYDLHDLDSFVNHVPYAEQQSYLGLARLPWQKEPVLPAAAAAAPEGASESASSDELNW